MLSPQTTTLATHLCIPTFGGGIQHLVSRIAIEPGVQRTGCPAADVKVTSLGLSRPPESRFGEFKWLVTEDANLYRMSVSPPAIGQ
jgi:hypothetical protein